MKILFITSTRIGDAVLSTGLLGWLVEHLPAVRIPIGWLLRSRRHHRLPADGAPLHRGALIGRTLGLDPPPAPRLWTAPEHDAAAARLLGNGGPDPGGPDRARAS